MTVPLPAEGEEQKISTLTDSHGVKQSPKTRKETGTKTDAFIQNINNDTLQEHVLVVPKKLTKLAQNVLFARKASPMAYHLEGRWGNRTFQVDAQHMGIPILDRTAVLDLSNKHDDLYELLHMSGVEMRYMPHVEPPKHRAREAPFFDATIHPERAPADFDLEQEIQDAKQKQNSVPRSEKPAFTYAELFAGMGGFGVALDALGGRCVFCSELEEHLRDVYKHNFVTIPNRLGRNSDAGEQRTECSADALIDIPMNGDIYGIPDSAFPNALDLLVAGFPCQPFSALGEQPGFGCPKSGNLFLEIVRVLNVSKPKAFLLENVQGLLSMTETYETIVEALENAGYDVYTEVISSRGLTATVRKRLYFVGLRRDDFTVDESGTSPGRHEQRNQFEFPFIPDLQIRARDVLDFDEMSEEELEILRLADDTLEQLLSSRRWRPHSLAWPNKSIDTVTSHYGNAVGRGETQLVPCSAPHSPRRFSIRECARVMGFPNSYEFLPPGERQSPMAYRKMHYRMCGNAVCPPVIAALAGSVLDCCRITCSREEGWVQHGRSVAIALALEATRKSPATLPRGCLVLGEY